MKLNQNTILVILFLGFFSNSLWAQNSEINIHASLAEKIYLQLDSQVYTTDKTIWFKAIVTDAIQHVPTKLSGILYVELIDSSEKIIQKKIIKLEKGIGEGFIELHPKYREGQYLIRAYTQWNKNFDKVFIFKEYIHVFATSTKKKVNPISNVTLIKKQNGERILKAYFNPFVLDSLHKKKLTLVVILDGKKDTLTLKKNREGNYLIDYVIPNESQLITLKMQTKNRFSHSETIILNEDYLDLQFFPESGELVHGLQSKVGFKALDINGKGISIKGEIVDEKGGIITSFQGNQLGMGSFVLPKVKSSSAYFAKLVSKSDEKQKLLYPLPKVSSLGNVLTIVKKRDRIQLQAASNYMKKDSIYLKVFCRGQAYFSVKGRLNQGKLLFSLSINQLPEGIIAFTVLDKSMNPLAERLYFNEREERRVKMNISTDKDIYSQREATKLEVETTNSKGDVLATNLSILVLNKDQMGQMQSFRKNILSHFLLSSDLKGEIENPGFYFRKDKTSYLDLDNLLLTQGWRKYNYTKKREILLFQVEKELSVSGSVGGAIFKNKRKKVELTLVTFGEYKSFQSQLVDSLGRFDFKINDEYGQKIKILIQSANKSGKKKNYTITLNKKTAPPIFFDQIKTINKVDSIINVFVEKNRERKSVEDAFQLSNTNLLDEVVLKARISNPERIKVLKEYGEADIIITGKAIQEKEKKWSYGLYSVILFNFPNQIEIRTRGHDLYARVLNAYGPTLVVIDGIPVMGYDYSLIPNIPPSEVVSFEIIKSAKNIFNLYMTIVPNADPRNAPQIGSVIAIYTHAGKGLFGANKPVGLLHDVVPVFSPLREFYAPRYKNLTEEDWIKPDLRALVHWEPNIMSNHLGKANTTFYNADNIGEMIVVVEAISNTGEIGYKEIVYEVQKEDNDFE